MRILQWIGLIGVGLLTGTHGVQADGPNKLDADVKNAIQLFKQADSKIQATFDTAQGYVVFPSISKGGAGIGAAEGTGEVFQKGALIGTAKMSQVTVGAQFGGQIYSEVIFFQTASSLDEFKEGTFEMSAQASAVAAGEGQSANAKYQNGVLIFTLAKVGFMVEASVGGQQFDFKPIPGR